MLKIDTTPCVFYSALDEAHLFSWLSELPFVKSTDLGQITIEDGDLSEQDIRDLIAVLYRYKIPMTELQALCTPANAAWFKDPGIYWHREIFGDS